MLINRERAMLIHTDGAMLISGERAIPKRRRMAIPISKGREIIGKETEGNTNNTRGREYQ